jgi:polysaccharide biosynthesis transport protein
MPETEEARSERAVPLREYLAVLLRRKWSIILVAGVVLASMLVLSFLQTPLYEATGKVLVRPVNQTASEAIVPLPPNLETERGLVSSVPVAERVVESLDISADPQDLLGGLSVEVVTGAEFLEITYQHPDPLEAQRRAQAFSTEYLDFRRDQALDDILAASETVRQRIRSLNNRLVELETQIEETTDPSEQADLEAQAATLESQVAVLQVQLSELTPAEGLQVGQVVEPATVPSSPASPNYLLNIALALFVGLALGIGLAFLRERLDDRLRGREDFEARAGAPGLAVVPRVTTWKRRKEPHLVAAIEPRTPASEAYRTLRTSMLFTASKQDLHKLLITSPQVEEGKTTTVANLGVVLAQAGKRVVLVDADLRKPRLHRFFSTGNDKGLTNVLAGEVPVHQVLFRPSMANLGVVPCGPVPGNPAELLSSDAMGSLLDQLAGASDFVLIDSAPVLVAADATILSTQSDGVLLIADADKATRASVTNARIQLDQVNANVIGAVLNNFDLSKARAYPYYYQYYYVYQQERPRRGLARRQAAQETPPVVPKERRGMWSG